MKIERFEDIVAWQKARELNKELFGQFKTTRNFTFRDQILRASLSITNNIAEGFERGSNKELKQFLTIARGSTAEVRSMLYIAIDNNYINNTQFSNLFEKTTQIGKLLTGFIKTLSHQPPIKLSNNLTKGTSC